MPLGSCTDCNHYDFDDNGGMICCAHPPVLVQRPGIDEYGQPTKSVWEFPRTQDSFQCGEWAKLVDPDDIEIEIEHDSKEE